jgi:hypothetical protein
MGSESECYRSDPGCRQSVGLYRSEPNGRSDMGERRRRFRRLRKVLYERGRTPANPVSKSILTQRAEADLSGEILLSGLEITLEGTIAGNETDSLVKNAKIYAKAVESMIMNIPSETLTANSDPVMYAAFFEQASVLDILRPYSSGFLQIFQTRCLYRLSTDGY